LDETKRLELYFLCLKLRSATRISYCTPLIISFKNVLHESRKCSTHSNSRSLNGHVEIVKPNDQIEVHGPYNNMTEGASSVVTACNLNLLVNY